MISKAFSRREGLRAIGLLIVILSMPVTHGMADVGSAVDRIQLFLPGLSVSTVCSEPIPPGSNEARCQFSTGGETFSIFADNDTRYSFDGAGNMYGVSTENIACPNGDAGTAEVFRIEPDASIIPVVKIPGECGTAGILSFWAILIDPVQGVMVLVGSILETDSNFNVLSGFSEILRITGLPNLFDIIPTFQPSDETMSWVTPKHPEALAAADRFQVFTGTIPAIGELSVPVPVACNVPAAGNPQPGDFLSILDPLPTPPLGEASYVIIGVEHAGNTRYGRQNVGGVLAGRSPAMFIGCG